VRVLRNFVVIFGSIALTLIVLELASRWMGIVPTPAVTKPHLDSGGWAVRDPLFGWKNKLGTDKVGSSAMTFWSDHSRATGPKETPRSPDIVFVGCSFTQGYGLNDDETMAWQVQAAHPDLVIKNFGTGGYGAYQALLMIEDIFRQPQVPKLVIFDFFYWHTVRDIAPFQWVRGFRDKRGEVVAPPYMLGDGSEHAPIFYGPWPLEERSSFVSMARLAYLKARHPSSMDKATDVAVATKIFARMQEVVASRGSKLVVAVLDPWPAEDGPQWAEWLPLIKPIQEGTPEVRQFLKDGADKGRLEFLECSPNETLSKPEFKLPDGHPNAVANAKWAACINRWLATRLNQ
jgi:hypothetical protein